MAITAKTVYHDTGNFFRNQFVTILLLSVLASLISALLAHVFAPSRQQIQLLNDGLSQAQGMSLTAMKAMVESLSPEQQRILLHSNGVIALSLLIGNTLLTGGLLVMIRLVSAGEQRVSVLRALSCSLPFLPRLFIQIFLVTLVVQVGLSVFVLPGVFFTILLAMAPVMLVQDQNGIFAAIAASVRLTMRNMWLISPAVLAWMLSKALLLFIPGMPGGEMAAIVLSVISNLISCALLIYLFRLYMLLR